MFKRLFGRTPAPAPPPSDPPRDHPSVLTDVTFDAAIQAPVLTVVDFWADWCQPCEVMSAFVEFLARDFEGRLRVGAIDVDEWPASAERLGVRGLPTLIFFRDGVELHRTTGVSTYDDLKRQTARLLREGAGGGDQEP